MSNIGGLEPCPPSVVTALKFTIKTVSIQLTCYILKGFKTMGLNMFNVEIHTLFWHRISEYQSYFLIYFVLLFFSIVIIFPPKPGILIDNRIDKTVYLIVTLLCRLHIPYRTNCCIQSLLLQQMSCMEM